MASSWFFFFKLLNVSDHTGIPSGSILIGAVHNSSVASVEEPGGFVPCRVNMWGRELLYSKLQQHVGAMEVFFHICRRSQYCLVNVLYNTN